MLKLKDILKESRVGYLVEKDNPILDKELKYKDKDGKQQTITVGGALKQGEDHLAYKQAKKLVDKEEPAQKTTEPKKQSVDKKQSKKDQEKSKKQKEKEMDFWDDDDDEKDDDMGFDDDTTDDYGNPVVDELGDKGQQQALELKMGIGPRPTKKIKTNSNHIVTNQDGKPVKLAVYQDPESKKIYGIDDEGNIYENDTDDFTDMKEPTADAKGFPGAVTKKGQTIMDKRVGKRDDEDSASFADLLDLLGIDTDIDYTNPFKAD